MRATLRMYWSLLSEDGRRKQLFLLWQAAGSGVVELISIGLVIPFIAVAADALPFGSAQKITVFLTGILSGWGVAKEHFTMALGLVFLSGVALANLYLSIYQYYSSWFIARQRYEMTMNAARHLCYSPLEWLELRHSAELSKVIMFDADRVGIFILAITQIGAVVVRFLVVAMFLFFTQPRLALGLGIPLAIGYWAVFKFLQKPLAWAGEAASLAAQQMSQRALEIIGAGREIRSAGLESRFYRHFEEAAQKGNAPIIMRNLPGQFTRAGLEVVTVMVVVLLLVYFHVKDGNLANGLPLMSAYAVAGVRLLPAVQQSLYLFFEMRFFAPSVEAALNMYGKEPVQMPPEKVAPLDFERTIRLENIEYAYPGDPDGKLTLRDITLEIPKNGRVAFVGSTGAGKSTLVDLILGLRFPRRGQILVDGTGIERDNLSAWHQKIGYVPQTIYLLDTSIAENIALGFRGEEIDREKVEKAARAANIHDFIVSLPGGYESRVGERGVRLSGGQVQRIGIARALYHEPEVVFFDEATSSLDSVTESGVLEALDNLKDGRTLVVIAHRLNTVWDFEKIFVLENGSLIAEGTSAELMQSCPQFAQLARKPQVQTDSSFSSQSAAAEASPRVASQQAL